MPTARLSVEVEFTCPVDTDYEKSRGLREKCLYRLINKFCIFRPTLCFPQFISFSFTCLWFHHFGLLSKFGRGVDRMEGGNTSEEKEMVK